MSKDRILTILWFTYSFGVGFFLTTLEGKVSDFEKFGLGFLLAQLLLGVWIAISILSNIPYRGVINLPKRKRFKKKVNPIYKIITNGDSVFWRVEKFELQYDNEHDFNTLILIPFARLFNVYRYVSIGFYDFEYDLEGVTNIGLLWEERFSREKRLKTDEKTLHIQTKRLLHSRRYKR